MPELISPPVEETLEDVDRMIIFEDIDSIRSTTYRIDGLMRETQTVRLSKMQDGTPLVLTYEEISNSENIHLVSSEILQSRK